MLSLCSCPWIEPDVKGDNLGLATGGSASYLLIVMLNRSGNGKLITVNSVNAFSRELRPIKELSENHIPLQFDVN